MDKIERVRKLLKDIGMPKRQQADLCVLTILGMADLKKTTKWSKATNEWLRIHDIIAFANQNYDVNYAENSREPSENKRFTISVQLLSWKTTEKQPTAPIIVIGLRQSLLK